MFKTYTVMELEQSNIQDCSCENSSQLQAVNYTHKKLRSRSLIGSSCIAGIGA